jgi:uncharacterized protein (TIGR02246 family)
MPARIPEECDRLFGEYVNAGDLDALVALYAPEASLVQHGGRVATGRPAIREVLGRVLAMHPTLRNDVVKVVAAADDLALVYNDWSMSAKGPGGQPVERSGKAIEVVRRQPDGTWLFVADDPYARGGIGPMMELLYEVTMDVDVQDLGGTPAGHRRVVLVKGGVFAGPRLKGTVLPGGGDWLTERADGVRALDVRIVLQTDDGHRIYAHYPGVFDGPTEVLQEMLTGGQAVDPSRYYFRTAPLFETASEKYAWLNRLMAVGIGRRLPGQVAYTVYAVL